MRRNDKVRYAAIGGMVMVLFPALLVVSALTYIQFKESSDSLKSFCNEKGYQDAKLFSGCKSEDTIETATFKETVTKTLELK